MLLGWLATFAVVLRVVVVVLPLGASFVMVTALCAGSVERGVWRAAIAAVVCVAAPLLLRLRAADWLAARKKKGAPPSPAFFVAVTNLIIVSTLSLGFADDSGRALRRHGDWFLGEKNGAVARRLRATVSGAAFHLERFDPHPAFAVVVLPPPSHPLQGPPEEPDKPLPPLPVPAPADWYHPLMGPHRAMPMYASRRFGAHRSEARRRPPECELGHCGVDIGSTIGEPVIAVHDGVVDRVNRNPNADAISGIFIVLSHREGTVRSRYIHLDSVREDLRAGSTVRGGEIIGRLGRTGVKRSAAHLHFALSLREGGRERFVDPEPYLREWTLVQPPDHATVASHEAGSLDRAAVDVGLVAAGLQAEPRRRGRKRTRRRRRCDAGSGAGRRRHRGPGAGGARHHHLEGAHAAAAREGVPDRQGRRHRDPPE